MYIKALRMDCAEDKLKNQYNTWAIHSMTRLGLMV